MSLILVIGSALGALLLVFRPFGDPPAGAAHGHVGFVLNGAVLALAPPIALLVWYSDRLRTPLPELGSVTAPRVGSGMAMIGFVSVALAVVPLAAYSRLLIGIGLLAAVLEVVAVAGFIEIKYPSRTRLLSDPQPAAGWVQWDRLWAGSWAVACFVALAIFDPSPLGVSLVLLMIGSTAAVTYARVVHALGGLGVTLAIGGVVGGAVVLFVQRPAVQAGYFVAIAAGVIVAERHRRVLAATSAD